MAYFKLTSLVLFTLRSTQNGVPPFKNPSRRTRPNFAASFTTSDFVKDFPEPPPSMRKSLCPVKAHIGDITSVVFPAPLESEHVSVLFSPTTTHTPRDASGYRVAA